MNRGERSTGGGTGGVSAFFCLDCFKGLCLGDAGVGSDGVDAALLDFVRSRFGYGEWRTGDCLEARVDMVVSAQRARVSGERVLGYGGSVVRRTATGSGGAPDLCGGMWAQAGALVWAELAKYSIGI